MTDWGIINAGRLAQLYPVTRDRVQRFLNYEGQHARVTLVTQGLRTWEQQQSLWNQGRSTSGKIVTNAKPGWSWHNFGMAVDVVPDDLNQSGLQPDWNETHPVWKQLLADALKFDLAEGAQWRSFPDCPHLYPKELPATPPDVVRVLFEQGGLPAVWRWADRTIMPVCPCVTDPEMGQ